MFTDTQKAALSAPLNRANVKSRQQGGRGVSYIEGWKVIDEANRIFGFDGWTRETVDLKCVSEKEREIGKEKAPGWGVSYIAKVKIVAFAGDNIVTREGVGAGHGIDRDCGQAHESAIKEAETDAMKRALMTFGNPFGLALYDKEQANVCDQDESKIRFLAECATKVATFKNKGEVRAWWESEDQKNARRAHELTNVELKKLMDDVKAKLGELPEEAKAA